MALSIYDTATMVAVVNNLKTPSNFLLDTFFPNYATFDTKEIAIDVDVGKRRLAPFVSPLVAGKPVEARGIQTNTFAPAYIKDKRPLDPLRPVQRAVGERIGGSMKPVDREAANLAFEMEDQIQMIDRRLEWMAASALRTGTILVSGEGYAPVTVNFGRDSALTIALTGAAVWSLANINGGTVSPSGNLDTWATVVLKKSGGVVTDIVFTNTPWNLFISDSRVKDSVWYPRSGDSRIEFGGGVVKGAIFKGVWGTYRLWLYNEWYVDENDVEQPMIPDGTVILGSNQLMGIRSFGAIIDPRFAYGALSYAPKSWIVDDPAQRVIMMQSSPLTVPARVNAAAAVTVF